MSGSRRIPWRSKGALGRFTAAAALVAGLASAVALPGCSTSPGASLQASSAGLLKARSEDLERAAAIDRALDSRLLRRSTRDNDLRLHVDGQAAYGALRDLIASAQKSIWIETFIWHNDATGIEIAQMLRKRALEGLDVRVLVDSAGTRDKDEDREVLRILLDHQVPVRLFNPYIADGANAFITHRKLYLADGNRALTGGMNIGREYEHEWHDLLVEARGSAARQMHQEFVFGWNHSKDGPEEELKIPPSTGPAPGAGVARLAVTSPQVGGDRSQEIKFAFSTAMIAARKRIRAFHTYLSDPDYIKGLEAALKRGVAVELLIPDENDVAAFKYIDRHYAGRLAEAGATVRLYGKRISHVKYMSVDGVWVSLGSANADSRSMYSNEELNLLCADPLFAQEADRRLFEKDWAESRIPTYADLKVPLHWKPVVTLAQILAYYI